LELFNGLSGRLKIELSEPPEQVSPKLLNLKASATAQVLSVKLELEVFDEDDDDGRPLTDAEWSHVVFTAPSIRLVGEGANEVVEHRAPDGKCFTVRDLAAAIEATERKTRASSEWLGGVDVHHIYFEGLEEDDDGAWAICWGS
jgi:hypothetical protein